MAVIFFEISLMLLDAIRKNNIIFTTELKIHENGI